MQPTLWAYPVVAAVAAATAVASHGAELGAPARLAVAALVVALLVSGLLARVGHRVVDQPVDAAVRGDHGGWAGDRVVRPAVAIAFGLIAIGSALQGAFALAAGSAFAAGLIAAGVRRTGEASRNDRLETARSARRRGPTEPTESPEDAHRARDAQ